MIEGLKKHFGDALIVADTTPLHMDYSWYTTKDGTLFGIEKKFLSIKEEQLLSSMFEPLNDKRSNMTNEQASWFQFLFQSNDYSNLPTNSTHCRIVQFHTSQPIIDQQDFQLAAEALFSSNVVLLWESDRHGLFIETIPNELIDNHHVEQIADTFTSDFYMDIHFFIGQVLPVTEAYPDYFQWEKRCFLKARKYLIHKQRVFSLADILPYLLLDQVDKESKNHIGTILNELKTDKELLETIKVYFESNLNVSNAAKKMYMHRNSLQYRIDKFIERTGIDIKHFRAAVSVYLCILTIENSDN
ncbi:helix-turn-helix domain-containing protein [Bacillus timonensis]|nr:helix-turn-helix domain-containing protein [Bacillus timonensis]